MIITKSKFVKVINRLKDYSDLQNRIDELFKDNIENRESDFMNAGSICIGHETIVIELLEVMFNDNNTISWWIYECNYGRDFRLGNLEDNGVQIDLSTPEKLYDYLFENLKEGLKNEI